MSATSAADCGSNVGLGGKVTFSDDGSPVPVGTVVFKKGSQISKGDLKPRYFRHRVIVGKRRACTGNVYGLCSRCRRLREQQRRQAERQRTLAEQRRAAERDEE